MFEERTVLYFLHNHLTCGLGGAVNVVQLLLRQTEVSQLWLELERLFLLQASPEMQHDSTTVVKNGQIS